MPAWVLLHTHTQQVCLPKTMTRGSLTKHAPGLSFKRVCPSPMCCFDARLRQRARWRKPSRRTTNPTNTTTPLRQEHQMRRP